MGWQPDAGHGANGEPGPGAYASGAAFRDPRLAGFTEGGEWDACAPGPELTAVLSAVAVPLHASDAPSAVRSPAWYE